MKEITIETVQGVGDIFWVYQKLSPYFDRINLRLLAIAVDPVQQRAVPWVKLLPKVGQVDYKLVEIREYDRVARSKFLMRRLLEEYDAGKREFEYACNKALEDGTRLENIDPEHMVDTNVEIKTEYAPIAFPEGSYITVYASGSTQNKTHIHRDKVWSVAQYVEFFLGLAAKCGKKHPIVIIGASYDRDVAILLERMLKRQDFQVAIYIDSYPANVCHILKHTQLFVGYQSGLGIYADALGTQQLMLYFPFLHKMLYTWCKKDHINSKYFATLFENGPKEALKFPFHLT